MKRLSILKGILTSTILVAPATALAGNIPQYLFSTSDAAYTPLSGATLLADEVWDSYTYILPEGNDPNNFVSKGFDLGMKFRFGGCEFDRFVPENNGRILLGQGKVDSTTAFSIDFQPIMFGLKKARISYSTQGTEGKRVFTLEYAGAECGSEGNSSRYPGFYDLQIKLYEENGRVEIIFHQPNDGAPLQESGFRAGLTGWNAADNLFLRGKALREFYDSRSGLTIYPAFTTATFPAPQLLDSSTYLVWDNDDYEEFTISYHLDPVMSKAAPEGSPQNLTVSQTASTITVTAERNPLAAATVILYSHTPFDASDYPVDGTTFPAGPDARFGDAVAIYYGDEDKITATIEGAGPDETYYIQALSVTGYPVYGKDDPAQIIYRTTQSAPKNFTARAISETDIKLSWQSPNPVIIAATTKKEPGYETGYNGLFNQPVYGVETGDILPDGAEVIYTGSADSFTFTGEPNTLYFFRAWSTNLGVVSSTWSDTAAVGTPAMPYEPDLTSYPLNFPLLGWDATHGEFMPTVMDFSGLHALSATSVNGSTVTLSSPAMPVYLPATVSFDFSLETTMGGGALPMGNEPGYFGTGALRVLVNGIEQYKVTEYNGTMRSTGQNGTYETGSSSMQSEKFNIPAVGEAVITFELNTSNTSVMYLRNFKVETEPDTGVQLTPAEAESIDFTKPIYNTTGLRIPATSPADLPAGLYITPNGKFIKR
ncbi:MAG: fibronectin type III domain-containing protein [Muribaculaceae bacterium]|nr:fibronectin type III domain-containing protein [Muribaculaceae bacterium]